MSQLKRWSTVHVWAGQDSMGGIVVTHADGSGAYVQPGDSADSLESALDLCGTNSQNIAGLLCDQLPEYPQEHD